MELRTNAKSSTTHFLHDGTPVVLINKGPFRAQTSSLIVWGREFLSQLQAALGDTGLRGIVAMSYLQRRIWDPQAGSYRREVT